VPVPGTVGICARRVAAYYFCFWQMASRKLKAGAILSFLSAVRPAAV
jgi:hypothetical protein